ncbi:MAG: FAD-binding protein [Betaproteobacteria bacterium]|nr:FAD-binding protein [Betaproteobacteria bacterium]
MRREKCRVLIIGGGLAGLQAAEVATQFIDEVVIVDRGMSGVSGGSARDASVVAAYLSEESGGLASPYFNRVRAAMQPPVPAEKRRAVNEAYADYSRQLIDSGAGLCDPILVEITVDGIYNRIGWMESYGLHWQRNADKTFTAVSAPGHSGARIAMLEEGPADVMRVMKQGIRHLDGRILDGIWITRLLTAKGRVCGAFGVDLQSNEPVVFEANSVILACGGGGRLYTDRGGSGDAFILAQQAGAKLANMEFSRFVPEPVDMRPDEPRELGLYLLGQRLTLENAQGKTFWSGGGSPALIAQGVNSELAKGPVTSRFDKEARARVSKLSALKSYAAGAGEKISWKLGCSGLLGGVSHHLFETGVGGLFVAGSASTGMHGTDALPGLNTSYNFCSGEEAGIRAAKQSLKGEALPEQSQIEAESARLMGRVSTGASAKLAGELEARIRESMWRGAGPVRDAKGLNGALLELEKVTSELVSLRAGSLSELRGVFEAENLARVGTMVCKAALDRKQSCGQHQRSDF